MKINAIKTKKALESIYDIPFDVVKKGTFDNSYVLITPENQSESLFDLKVKIKNGIRLVIEMEPQKYAQALIKDMSQAIIEKKIVFTKYASILNSKGASISLYINNELASTSDFEKWPNEWSDYSCRITKSPIVDDNESEKLEKKIIESIILTVGMFLSLLNITIVENDESDKGNEGGCKRVLVNKYERNPVNRELCVQIHGYSCKICGMSFEKKYGSIGEKFIHVHHIVPISYSVDRYILNPITELIPICPNCHAMVHKKDPPYLPSEMIEIIRNEKN